MIYKKACVYIKKSIGKLKILTAKSQVRGFEDIDFYHILEKAISLYQVDIPPILC